MGSTVNLSIGWDGIKVRYTSALIAITGAASPIALDIARIVPVNIPGSADGSTTPLITCHWSAPIA